jgi:hypothetical protein
MIINIIKQCKISIKVEVIGCALKQKTAHNKVKSQANLVDVNPQKFSRRKPEQDKTLSQF